jgi:hypothetical protein
VGQKRPNRAGLFDMLGNGLEFTMWEPTLKGKHEWCMRGFNFRSSSSFLLSGTRSNEIKYDPKVEGFRIARTID